MIRKKRQSNDSITLAWSAAAKLGLSAVSHVSSRTTPTPCRARAAPSVPAAAPSPEAEGGPATPPAAVGQPKPPSVASFAGAAAAWTVAAVPPSIPGRSWVWVGGWVGILRGGRLCWRGRLKS